MGWQQSMAKTLVCWLHLQDSACSVCAEGKQGVSHAVFAACALPNIHFMQKCHTWRAQHSRPCSGKLKWWASYCETSTSPSLHSYTNYSCQPRSDTAPTSWQVVWCSFLLRASGICLSSFGGKGNQLLKTRSSTERFAKYDLGTRFPLFFSFSAQDQLLPTVNSQPVGTCTYRRLFHCQNHWHIGQREGVTGHQEIRRQKQTSVCSFL